MNLNRESVAQKRVATGLILKGLSLSVQIPQTIPDLPNGTKPSLQWVANQLNAERMKAVSGKMWTTAMVYHFVYGAGSKVKRESEILSN